MIPRTLFDSEHEQFRESFRRFLEAEAVPHYDQWEKDGEIESPLCLLQGRDHLVDRNAREQKDEEENRQGPRNNDFENFHSAIFSIVMS